MVQGCSGVVVQVHQLFSVAVLQCCSGAVVQVHQLFSVVVLQLQWCRCSGAGSGVGTVV